MDFCGHNGPNGQDGRLTYDCIAANGAIILLNVVDPLLRNQIESQSNTFENEGGFTERLYRIRKQARKNQS